LGLPRAERDPLLTTVIVWGGFVLLVLVLLAFDLGAFSGKKSQAISARQALFRCVIYAALAALFTVFVYHAYERHWFDLGHWTEDPTVADAPVHHGAKWIDVRFPFEPEFQTGGEHGLPASGADAATMFFTGYLVEQSLSMDNIFVIALILGFFQVPAAYQHRVLLWGILGALIMRGVMIGLGAAIIHAFNWVIYVFGALLIVTAFKMAFSGEDHLDFEDSRLVKLARKLFRVHAGFFQDHFFVRMDGRWAITPLFLALMIVESTDLLFAVDSIPAVFGITHDPFLVFTSNVFAILGLRSLYFALADLLDKFRFLKYSLVVILGFVGMKMLLHAYIGISPLVSLAVIAVMLAVGVGASWFIPVPPVPPETPEPAVEIEVA
jgi:tellurite resistance protein TerC